MSGGYVGFGTVERAKIELGSIGFCTVRTDQGTAVIPKDYVKNYPTTERGPAILGHLKGEGFLHFDVNQGFQELEPYRERIRRRARKMR